MTRRRTHIGRRPDVSVVFDNDPRSPGHVRRALAVLLSDPDDPIADKVQLVVSELVSNVVQHTTSGGFVRAWDPKPDVPFRIEVTDHDPVTRTPNVPRPVGERDLILVERLADEWGVAAIIGGKIVWAEFDRTNTQPLQLTSAQPFEIERPQNSMTRRTDSPDPGLCPQEGNVSEPVITYDAVEPPFRYHRDLTGRIYIKGEIDMASVIDLQPLLFASHTPIELDLTAVTLYRLVRRERTPHARQVRSVRIVSSTASYRDPDDVARRIRPRRC